MTPDVSRDNSQVEGWFKLEPRNEKDENVSGEIHIKTVFHKKVKQKIEPTDFEILKLIGKGKRLFPLEIMFIC
jgi:serine/threonine protein kinase SCH9